MKDKAKETNQNQAFHFKITHIVAEDGTVIETLYRPADLCFRRERDLSGFIAINAEKFAHEVLNGEQGGRYALVCKNPAKPEENRSALGHLLNLGRIDEEEINKKQACKLILLTTLFDIETAKTIKHYNLPIRYIHFAREGENEGK